MSTENKSKFSTYGKYSISDRTELKFPQTQIVIEKKDNRFSYYRKSLEDQELKKSLSSNNEKITFEIVPILPLNLPAKKTNDLMFLRLAESVFIEKNSTSEILFQFPIEIGIFIINSDGTKDFFDCFTCDPVHSRFAMYGTAEIGKLCMYGKVSLMEKSEKPEPYVFAKMKATITNELNKGISIGKLVFPVSDHNIYYLDDSSESHIDDITAVVRNGIANDVLEIEHEIYPKAKDVWSLSPKTNAVDGSVTFTMEWGFD